MKKTPTVIVLLLILLCVTFYSLSILQHERTHGYLDIPQEASAPMAVKTHALESNKQSGATSLQPILSTKTATTVENMLPFLIRYKGVDLNAEFGLFEAKGDLQEVYIGDRLFDEQIVLTDLSEQTATLTYLETKIIIKLEGSNLLAQAKPVSMQELLQMTPEQIGTRPRIIQHLMRLMPTPFIADGMLASPGLNPALFEQAGLLEDDVVKQVNGLRVTIPSELDEIQRRLPQLSTLELLIERRGRTLTIILDIPSESLSISH